jgi:hypothetical protein
VVGRAAALGMRVEQHQTGGSNVVGKWQQDGTEERQVRS